MFVSKKSSLVSTWLLKKWEYGFIIVEATFNGESTVKKGVNSQKFMTTYKRNESG